MKKGKTTGEKIHYRTWGKNWDLQKNPIANGALGVTVIIPKQAPSDLKLRLREAAGLWRSVQKGTQDRKDRAAAMDKLILEALSKGWSRGDIARALMMERSNVSIRIRNIDNTLSKE
jgi:DNA-binding NarL/FixJ family response regulator